MADVELDDSHLMNAWPAFVDLLAATVLVFLVLITVVIVWLRPPGLRHWRAEVIRQLIELRASDTTAFLVDESPDELTVRITLPAEATFPPSRFQFDSLTREAQVVLDNLSRILRRDSVLAYTAEVRVVGYTDTDPFRDPRSAFSNWELSGARASAIARYLVTRGGVDPCKVSATGRGSHFPVGGDNGIRDAERSRRIEIQILPATGSSIGQPEDKCDPIGDGTIEGGNR